MKFSKRWNKYAQVTPNFFLTSGVVLLLWLALWPYRKVPYANNEGIFTCIAHEMHLGAKLYFDVWDHKPPLLFAQFELVEKLFGRGETGLHSYVFLIHLVNILMIFLLARRFAFSLNACWQSAYLYVLFLYSPLFYPWTAQADLLMLPFLLISFYLAFLPTQAWWFGAGFFWSAAFFTKQSALFFLPVYLIPPGNSLRKMTYFFLGIDVLSLCIGWPYIAGRSLPVLWEAVSGYNGSYIVSSWSNLSDLEPMLAPFLLAVVFSFGLPLFFCLRFFIETYLRQNGQPKIIHYFCSAWFATGLVSCFASGLLLHYYFLVMLPVMALMGSIQIESLLRWRPKIAGVLICLVLTPFIFSGALAWKRGPNQIEIPNLTSLQEAKRVGIFLGAHGKPGDSLFAWANSPQIYTYSGLRVYSAKTLFIHHLYSHPDEIEKIRQKFSVSPPQFILQSKEVAAFSPIPDWLSIGLTKQYKSLSLAGISEGHELYQLK